MPRFCCDRVHCPADTICWISVGSTLVQRRRRLTNVEPTLIHHFAFAGRAQLLLRPLFNSSTLKYLCMNYGDQRVFLIWIHINVLVGSFRFFEYLCYGSTAIIHIFFSVGTVFRRQNPTSWDVSFWRLKTVPALKRLAIPILLIIVQTRRWTSVATVQPGWSHPAGHTTLLRRVPSAIAVPRCPLLQAAGSSWRLQAAARSL